MRDFELQRDGDGRLVLVEADGTRHAGVHMVRAFPLSAPEAGLSVVGANGHELRWVPDMAQLAPHSQTLAAEELALREFAPTIARLVAVSGYGVPSAWTVETDRGEARLILKAEEDIRRLPGGALRITDADGNQWRVADRFALDKASRRMLERFL